MTHQPSHGATVKGWNSPRCGSACWAEIERHEAAKGKLMTALLDMTRDRNEWREQHENLLAMYRAEVAQRVNDHSEQQS